MKKKEKETKRKFLNMRMTPELYYLLQVFARRTGKSVTTLIETLIVNGEYISYSTEATEAALLCLRQLGFYIDELKEVSRQLSTQTRIVEGFVQTNGVSLESLNEQLVLRNELLQKLYGSISNVETIVNKEDYKKLFDFNKVNRIQMKNLYQELKLECELEKIEMDAIKEFIDKKSKESSYEDIFETLNPYNQFELAQNDIVLADREESTANTSVSLSDVKVVPEDILLEEFEEQNDDEDVDF